MADAEVEPIFQPLGRKKAYEEVAAEMSRLIFGQHLPPAYRLPTERELAEQFGVSRMVVREAIRMLERSGLLAVKKGPRGGIFVAQDYDRPINESIENLLAGGGATLDDLFEMRLLIEPFAASRAAELRGEEDLARLAALVEQAQATSSDGASSRAPNIEFHRLVLQLSGNAVMSVLGEAVLNIMCERIRNLTDLETSRHALGIHVQILEALRKRQPRKASILMARDIRAVGEMLSKLTPETRTRLARQRA